jgi:hypothetical protein
MKYEEALKLVNENNLHSEVQKELESNMPVVISRDNLVVAAGEKRGLNYSESFKFLRDNRDVEVSEVSVVLDKTYKEARKAKKDVIIDMTNMSKKSRRKWINEFKGYRIQCKLFVTGFEALVACNKKRGNETGKYISKGILLDMCKRFSLPMYSEGFTEIDYIWNS